MPNRPWAEVGTGLFTFDNKDYLITVDYHSNFWEIDYLTDTKSVTDIRELKAHFARQGIPDITKNFYTRLHHLAILRAMARRNQQSKLPRD